MPRRSHDSARHGIVRFGSLVRTGSCRARTKNRADNLRQSICSLSFFLAHLLSHSLPLSLTHQRSAFHALPKDSFTPRTFPFIEEGVLLNLFVSCSSLVLVSRPSPTYSLFSFFLPSRSLTLILSLSLSLSLPFLDIFFRNSTTHFEALRFRPHIPIVSGDRRFGNTPRCKQLLINVILPAHF